jgi:RHS repeat-associated protein
LWDLFGVFYPTYVVFAPSIKKGFTYPTNVYLRDASGNVMAIYETINPSNTSPIDNIAVKEIPIYGSTRLGQYRPFKDELGQVDLNKKTALGQRIYEFANHLGNVLVTLTDNKVPQTDGTYKAIVLSASDYYPFGMVMKERTFANSEYRFGFNGKENDTDFGDKQLIQDYGFRLYCPEIVRFVSVDPLSPSYPWYTPYQFAGNKPILCVDLDGGEEKVSNTLTFTDNLVKSAEQVSILNFEHIGYSYDIRKRYSIWELDASYNPYIIEYDILDRSVPKPSDALKSLVAGNNSKRNTVECAMGVQLVLLYSALLTYGDEKFNNAFLDSETGKYDFKITYFTSPIFKQSYAEVYYGENNSLISNGNEFESEKGFVDSLPLGTRIAFQTTGNEKEFGVHTNENFVKIGKDKYFNQNAFDQKIFTYDELKIHLENLVLGLALDYEAEYKIQEVETYEIDEEKLSN